MAIELREIFKNDIQRKINGVISAGRKDDSSELDIEFSEYVVTQDVNKNLNNFFTFYNEARPAKNGVWISGFFGSGKSHLLKILSYLLENAKINGKTALSYFEPKLSDSNDQLLLAAMRKACSIPSESILFNLFQNNAVDKDGTPDSILPIFMRQLYEHMGYYGADFAIAKMENELDDEGKLKEFIAEFELSSGKKWTEARERRNIYRSKIAQAYAKVTEQDVDPNLLQKYDAKYNLADFADKVRRYIDSKGKDFRLNFFVDEAGQFVVKNIRLMVELQEVATTLSDKCDNRAWVIVTSQDELDKFIGSPDNKTTKDDVKNDVTKIQDRFYIKLKLTNENVNEVIQKRLLAKNYEGKQKLSMIYSSTKDRLGALFGFVSGPKTFRICRDDTEFINTYPFVTYQFDLFKSSFTALSSHGAFPGEYTSTGARSLLDVFHKVLQNLAGRSDLSTNVPIVPFDAFYSGIEDNLMENFKQSIFVAENNIGDKNPFAIRVLKALLLVKYIPKDFKASVQNISVLLLTSLDENPNELREKTQKALDLLESQTYIQRKNSDEYDFLTNEEKDVETEIKNELLTDDKIYDELNTIIYRNILQPVSKAKDDSGNVYSITKQIDDRTFGPKYDISIVIATRYQNGNNLSKDFSYPDTDLVIMLEDDGKLFPDIILKLQTETYIRHQNVDFLPKEKRLVIDQKNLSLKSREDYIENSVRKYLEDAPMYIKGVDLKIKPSTNVCDRVKYALKLLVEKVYTNLAMLNGRQYNDQTVLEAFSCDITPDMLKSDSEAEKQILSKLASNKNNGISSTIRFLVDSFIKIPYGWPDQAVIYLLVILYRKGKIEIKQNGKELQIEEIKNLINRIQQWQSLVVEPFAEIDQGKIRRVKQFYQDFASNQCPYDSAKDIAKDLNEVLKARLEELDQFKDKERYPFLVCLDKEKELLKDCVDRNTAWYFDSFIGDISDELLDLENDYTIDLLRFMTTKDQIGKYDQAYDLLKKRKDELDEKSKQYWCEIKEIIDDKNIFKKSTVSKLPDLCSELEQYFGKILLEEKQKSYEEIKNYEKGLCSDSNYINLNNGQKAKVDEAFQNWLKKLNEASTKENIGSTMFYCKKEIEDLIERESQNEKANSSDVKKTKKKSIFMMPVFTEIPLLKDKADVDRFVEKLKVELEKAIDDGFTVER